MENLDQLIRRRTHCFELTTAKYYEVHEPRELTILESVDLSLELASRTRMECEGIDLVVGIANGATMVATVIGSALSAPVRIVRVRRRGSRLKQAVQGLLTRVGLSSSIFSVRWLKPLRNRFERRMATIEAESLAVPLDLKGKRVVLVDDAIDTGASISSLLNQPEFTHAAEVFVAVFAWYCFTADDPRTRYNVKPNVYLHRVIHCYPWAVASPHYVEYLNWMDSNGLEIWK